MPLLLDGIEFRDFELPEELPIGGEQSVAVHQAIGGKRIVDAMGPNDAPITWSGTLYGPLAERKAQVLDLLRRSGRAVELTWSGFAWLVVVTSFVARLQGLQRVPYTIECVVVQDLVAGAEPEETAALEEALAADLAFAEAMLQARDAALQTVIDVEVIVRTAMRRRGALRGLGITLLSDLTKAAVRSAEVTAADAVVADTALLAAQAAFSALRDGGRGEPAAAAAAFRGQVTAAEQAYAARGAAAAMARVRANVGTIAP